MKIGIVGAGFVGSTAAYALVMSGVGRQIVLVDKNEARARAEADDLLHAVPFAHPLDVVAGGYEQLAAARVVILTAGVNQRPGESRLELLARNAAVFREVVPGVLERAPEAVLVVATNPVDVMTHLAARFAAERGVPAGRVFGSGTTLDTARFRALLGRRLGVDAAHVHAYVVGEHGDSEVLTWSLVTVGGIPLADMAQRHGVPFDAAVQAEIDAGVRRAAYLIISGKGATYYGVGSALARIVDAVLGDRRSVLTVCTPISSVAGVANVTVSLPRLVGGGGVMETLPLALPPQEEQALARSARVVRDAIDGLGIG
ncbi:MAG TPA: L-lactate dehydrogenase [Vicinamibacteria bacterium]|nr:L-lactate dehydrogenase [Vicinamibacteria bacterium]